MEDWIPSDMKSVHVCSLATRSGSMADMLTKELKLGATGKLGNTNHGCIIVLSTHMSMVVWCLQLESVPITSFILQ